MARARTPAGGRAGRMTTGPRNPRAFQTAVGNRGGGGGGGGGSGG